MEQQQADVSAVRQMCDAVSATPWIDAPVPRHQEDRDYEAATRIHRETYASAYLETTITVEYTHEYGDRLPSTRIKPVGIDVTAIKHHGWNMCPTMDSDDMQTVCDEAEKRVLA